MKSKLLNLFIVGGLASATMTMTACSDTDLALGAGVIIGAIISDDGCDYDCHHHHHHQPNPPRYDERRDRDHGRHRYDAHFVLPAAAEVAVDQDVVATANHYGLEIDAASKVMSALKSAEQKDFSKLAALGFQREDFVAMAKGENPSVTALRTMSANLNMDIGDGSNLIQLMKADLAAGLSK